MTRPTRVRLNLMVDATHPALLEALLATASGKRTERMRCLAAIGLAAERGQLWPSGAADANGVGLSNGAVSAQGQPPPSALAGLAWDDGLLGDDAA